MAALTLSELQSLRDALIRARASGTREIQDQNGERISYKSDSEMSRAIADLESRIAAMQSGQQVNVIKFKPSKFGD